MEWLKVVIQHLAFRFGYRLEPDVGWEPEHREIFHAVQPYTQTRTERLFALIEAVKYVVANDIPGCIVECGVWRGGSVMAVARTLLNLHREDRDLFLFDTFEGMPRPTAVDVDFRGASALPVFESMRTREDASRFNRVDLEEVRRNVLSTGYDRHRFHFVKGKVEDTIPQRAPESIALLRLDTDWYESTRHELIHLYPRLSPGGVLIIDDYGHFQGARKATDEYIAGHRLPLLLHRIDYTGRIAVKPWPGSAQGTQPAPADDEGP
jgi:hypothetical protein